MWERKPDDWPVGVMFLDPNNKMKEQGGGGSKPTKEILVPMLLHLVRKYQVKLLFNSAPFCFPAMSCFMPPQMVNVDSGIYAFSLLIPEYMHMYIH